MRIGFFTDSCFPGIDGVTYTIEAWHERLEERGHEVYVIHPQSSYEPDEACFHCFVAGTNASGWGDPCNVYERPIGASNLLRKSNAQ